MTTARLGAVRLRTCREDELAAGLATALSGGPPVAPLPGDRVEADRALAMLQPDIPLEEADDVAAVVSTSGSTGAPKGVLLSRTAIRASVTATQERLGGPGDWALALPAHYVAGLMVLARASLAGTTVAHVRRDLADLPLVADTLDRPRYVSVVPTQLVRACARPELVAALTTFDAVLVGGGPADPTLLARARSLGIRVLTTYGMSETCGGVVYDGEPLSGVDVELGGDGRVSIGGDLLFSGYRLRPDLTESALRDGRLRTQDRGRWHGGRLEILGRIDDVVVTGGLNVDLAEVERQARPWSVGQGHDLAVLGVADPEWGTRVVAVTEASGSLADLQRFLSDQLPAYAVPRELVRVAELPRTSSGKVDRQALRSLLAQDAS